jgi:hypothetical protein
MKKWKAIRDNFVKGIKQRNTTNGQPALKKRRYIFFDQFSFCCLLLAMEKIFSNIPPTENDTVDVAGGSATDESSELTVYQEEQPIIYKIHNHILKSNRSKINGKGKNKIKYFNSN